MQTLKVLEKLKPVEDQELLEYAIALNFDNLKPELLMTMKKMDRSQKVFVTKLNKAINLLCNKHKKEIDIVLASLEGLTPKNKEFILASLSKFMNNRTFNNYRFIRMFEDPAQLQAVQKELPKLEMAKRLPSTSLFIRDFVKIEYKVELVLSSIAMKRVLRPFILIIFHTRQGTKERVTLNVEQFQELRKNIALSLSLIHKVEAIKNY